LASADLVVDAGGEEKRRGKTKKGGSDGAI